MLCALVWGGKGCGVQVQDQGVGRIGAGASRSLPPATHPLLLQLGGTPEELRPSGSSAALAAALADAALRPYWKAGLDGRGQVRGGACTPPLSPAVPCSPPARPRPRARLHAYAHGLR